MKSVWSSFIIGNYLIFFLIIQHPNWSINKEKKYMHISFQSLQLDSWNCYVCDKILKTWSTPKITEMLIYSLECLHLKFWKVCVTNHALQAKLTYAIGFLNYRYVSELRTYPTLPWCNDFQIYILENTALYTTYFPRYL